MKTAISLPDKTYREAEAYAKRHRLTRSSLYAEALKSYLDHRVPDDITARLNSVYEKQVSSVDPALAHMQAASMPKESW